MKKPLLIIIIVCIVFAGYWIYIITTKPKTHWEKPARKTPKVDIAKDYTFPDNNRQFAVKISAKKVSGTSSFNKQQAITIYLLRDESKPAFKRDYNADGFSGPDLSYTFATDAASFTQRGSLAVLDCGVNTCKLPWTNLYTWNKQKNIFIIDNAAHAEYFDTLITQYNQMDKTNMPDKDITLLQKAKATATSITSGKNLSSLDIR